MHTCILCKSSKKDDVQYGEFLKNKNFGVHTYCLYLSSNLSQNGNDDEGFLGFLEVDIRKEVRRISSLKCFYCHKYYANIGCCNRKCRRSFHFICGLDNNAQNQFCRDFRSFCHRHVRKYHQHPSKNEKCLICYDNLKAAGKNVGIINMILTPCCRNGWFHKICLQEFAKTAGYFFKCPLCNDANIFREMLRSRGIFIPDQDAAWELEPNAFAELLERPNECAAQQCKNKKGRKASSDNNPFVMCTTCGSTAMHRQCLPIDGKRFYCADCTIALDEEDSGRESLNSHCDKNEDEFVDVCHVSDTEDLDLIDLTNSLRDNKSDSGNQYHDSESSDDDKIHRVTKHVNITRKIRDSSVEVSDDGGFNPIKVSQKICVISDSEESELPEVSSNVKYKKNKKRIDSESSQDTSPDKVLKPKCKFNSRRLKTDSESSENYTRERKSPNVYTASGLDLIGVRTINIKRDSGSHYDDSKSSGNYEIPNVTKHFNITRKIRDSSEEASDEEDFYPIKVSQKKFIISDSEESVLSKVSSNVKNEKNKKRIDSESSQDTLQDEVIKCKVNFMRLKTDSESGENCTRERKSPNVNNDSDIKEQQVNIEKTEFNIKKERANSFSSTEEKVMTFSRKRKSLNGLGNSEEEPEELLVAKQKCFDNTIESKIDSSIIYESDDPSESFFEVVENDKNSCNAFNTRSSQQLTEVTSSNKNKLKNNVAKLNEISLNERPKKCKLKPTHTYSTQENSLDMSCIAGRTRRKSLTSHRNDIKTLKPTQTYSSQENGLDISCIAGRTRRKSLTRHRDDINNYKKEIENPLNMSCIAIRTRRKTICAQTNYSKKSLFELSQVYEKVHESDEELISLNENKEETKQELELCEVLVDTDLDYFKVNYAYEEKDSKFEISCIANRTRRRKSLKSHNQRMQKTSEDDDCSSSSSNSSAFCYINLRKRCNKRILSSSSEEMSNSSSSLPKTIKTKTISPALLPDKLPQHNYAAFLKNYCSKRSSSSKQNVLIE